MATNIVIVAESLKHEAEEYKMLYDGLVSAKERELKELRDNYKPGSKLLAEKKKQAEESFNSSMTRLKVRAADSALTGEPTKTQGEDLPKLGMKLDYEEGENEF